MAAPAASEEPAGAAPASAAQNMRWAPPPGLAEIEQRLSDCAAAANRLTATEQRMSKVLSTLKRP